MVPYPTPSPWPPPRPPSVNHPLAIGPPPLRAARATIAVQAAGTTCLAASSLVVAVMAALSGTRWLALAGIAVAVGCSMLGLAFGLYRVMIELGGFSRRARIAAILMEIALAPPGLVMAVVGDASSAADPNQGPFADGELGLMVLLGGALVVGSLIVVAGLTLPKQVRRLFARQLTDPTRSPPPVE